jgi:hypothetical protein
VIRAAKRVVVSALVVLGAASCGPRYATNGSCTQDTDCVVCALCACARAYSITTIDTATCTQVGQDVSCVPEPDTCIPAGAQQSRCVSGSCQVTSN